MHLENKNANGKIIPLDITSNGDILNEDIMTTSPHFFWWCHLSMIMTMILTLYITYYTKYAI